MVARLGAPSTYGPHAMFNPNNYGLILTERERLRSTASLAIGIAALHYFLLALFYIFHFWLITNRDYFYTVLYFAALPGVTLLLATAVAAQQEVSSGTVGEIDGAHTVGKVGLGFIAVATVLSVIAAFFDFRSSGSKAIYLLGLAWTVSNVIAWIVSIMLLQAIVAYRREFRASRADLCLEKIPAGRFKSNFTYMGGE